jgi:hypothetical protein
VGGLSNYLRQLGGLTAEVVGEKYGQALATTLEGFQKYGGNKYVKRAGEIANHIKGTLGKPIKEAWGDFVTKFKPPGSPTGCPGAAITSLSLTSCSVFRAGDVRVITTQIAVQRVNRAKELATELRTYGRRLKKMNLFNSTLVLLKS